MPSGRLFIKGTWDGRTASHLVEQTPDGTYQFLTRLGETRVEKFHLNLEENDNFALFPAAPDAGPEIRTEGPKPLEVGRAWLIDGRDEGWAEGTLLRITCAADPANGSRKIAWESVD